MLHLTREDYEEILSNLGSNQAPFENEQQFLEWISNTNLDGQQYAEIQDYLKEKTGTDPKIYNRKEGRDAQINAFLRLKQLLLGETPVPTVKSEQPVVTSSSETEKKSESVEAHIAVNVTSMKDEVDYFLSNHPKFEEDEQVDCTGNNVHYRGKNIIIEDEIGLIDFNSDVYSENFIVLLNGKDEMVATGTLTKCSDDYRISTNSETTVKKTWGNNSSFKVLLFPKKIDDYLTDGKYPELFQDDAITSQIRYVGIKITEKERPFAESPLCIDFGTSNTTAGYYVDEKEDAKRFVNIRFHNTLEQEYTISEIYPTLLYVKHCDRDHPEQNEYLFGFDAKKALIEADYTPTASVFYELKRWFGIDPGKEVEITDEESNDSVITYAELVKAYLLHIIRKAEDFSKMRFNRVHFTAPVKLKDKFMKQFQALFSGEAFTVETESSLDEGISVVYETVRNNIRSKKEFKNTNLMIIDCGGGTTDVASCNIGRERVNDIENLSITTTYVGGDANFGGNNITYRIMQFVKIKLAFYYSQEMGIPMGDHYSVFINEILSSPEEILNQTDKNENVYSKLEEEYQQAEKIIPTMFEDSDNKKYAKKKEKIKRNFYYLWNLAESIKTEFYKKDELTLIGFNHLSEPTMNDNYENILDESNLNFSIFVRNGKELEKKTNLPQISITAQEVDDLIRGDIYRLLCRIFPKKEDADGYENTDYECYRFSGQSCKIRLFNELMREFIPGKKLRSVIRRADDKMTKKIEQETEVLKTTCIRGTVYYEYDVKHGNMKPNIQCQSPKFECKVLTEFNGNENVVLDSSDVKLFAIPNEAEHISFMIQNRFGETINRCNFKLPPVGKNPCNSTTISEVLKNNTPERYQKKITEELACLNGERYCFVYPAKSGFQICPIVLKIVHTDDGKQYYISNPKPISIEDANQTFFDGNK